MTKLTGNVIENFLKKQPTKGWEIVKILHGHALYCEGQPKLFMPANKHGDLSVIHYEDKAFTKVLQAAAKKKPFLFFLNKFDLPRKPTVSWTPGLENEPRIHSFWVRNGEETAITLDEWEESARATNTYRELEIINATYAAELIRQIVNEAGPGRARCDLRAIQSRFEGRMTSEAYRAIAEAISLREQNVRFDINIADVAQEGTQSVWGPMNIMAPDDVPAED